MKTFVLIPSSSGHQYKLNDREEARWYRVLIPSSSGHQYKLGKRRGGIASQLS